MNVEHKGWTIRVSRMAVSPAYPTPIMAMACINYAPGKRFCFNKEGATEQEALRLAQQKIDMGVTLPNR